MDPFGAFKTEVFRPIASIVLPGLLATGPLTISLANEIPEILQLFQSQPAIFFLLLTGVSTIAGMLLENVGSSIERGIDRCMEIEYLPGVERVWGHYLALTCTESYARKYLGSLITRLKFINSMIPAILLFGVGIWLIHLQLDRWSTNSMLLLTALILVVASWLFRTSTELSEAALFSRLKMLPKELETEIDISANTVSRFRHLAYVITELRSSRVSEVSYKDLIWWRLLIQVLATMVVAIPAKAKDAKP